MKHKIFGHCSYIGTTGYNSHSRNFFRALDKFSDVKIRNFTIGKSWDGLNDRPHEGEPYLDKLDRKLLVQQTCWNADKNREDFKIYDGEVGHIDVNIVLNETNHYFFYDNYIGPKIAYNVWESTRQPEDFFNQLKKFDQVWVPSKWQRDCMIEQGYDKHKLRVVPEGVDVRKYYPEDIELSDDGRKKFVLFGRWDYRKSTKEIIETFIKTFDKNEPVDLIVSIDNVYGEAMDGFKTTEERLEHYGLTDERIKVIHFPSDDEYVKYLKGADCFVSCARGEGWNLPLIEAMACGTPSIYSNATGQLEFAEGKGHPVKIKKRVPTNGNTYGRFEMGEVPGEYYEPDFDDLSRVMRNVYELSDDAKEKAIKESVEIRNEFTWTRMGLLANVYVSELLKDYKNRESNEIKVTFTDGPRVEILGETNRNYFVEFLDKGEVIHSGTISNNMWISAGRKWFTEWEIKIDGETYHKFNSQGKNVRISLDSKSIGDTIAWIPYVLEFKKKWNCNLIVSTFHNEWFENLSEWEDVKFIHPDYHDLDLYASYKIGWFKTNGQWDKGNHNPNQCNLIPLQQTASDILGLDYQEIKPKIDFKPTKINRSKYIAIAPHSTARLKYWRKREWEIVVKYLNTKGYDVINVSYENTDIKGVIELEDKSWNSTMNTIANSKLFIGLSSGLSWISWALNKQVIMISNFSNADHEFKSECIRITNESVCNSCWNNPNFVFDAGDWNWCPIHKNTDNQFICHTSIKAGQVINKLKPLL